MTRGWMARGASGASNGADRHAVLLRDLRPQRTRPTARRPSRRRAGVCHERERIHMNRIISLFPAALLTVFVAFGCSSKSNPSSSTAKKGGGATSATSAKTSGQKAGQAALTNKTKAVAKGVAAGGTGKQKGGGARTAAAAKLAGQKATTTAKVVLDKEKATD